jgi:hypothetical protein
MYPTFNPMQPAFYFICGDVLRLRAGSRQGYPPFELAGATGGADPAFFDGKVLAAYLVATGSFEHPLSRRRALCHPTTT